MQLAHRLFAGTDGRCVDRSLAIRAAGELPLLRFLIARADF
jgi:hypothetical protein